MQDPPVALWLMTKDLVGSQPPRELLGCALRPALGGEHREKLETEANHSTLVGGNFNKQGNWGACLGPRRMSG